MAVRVPDICGTGEKDASRGCFKQVIERYGSGLVRMSRRVVVAVVVPVGVYATLLVISLLGGPRVSLPGGGGVVAAAPVTGPPQPSEPGHSLPPIPHQGILTPAPSSPPLSTGPLDERGQPGQPPATVDERPPATSLPEQPSQPPTVAPTPGVVERRNPSMPPATKTPPPLSPPPTDPTAPPSTPGTPTPSPTVTPSPKPPSLADTLLILLGKLRR